MKGKLVVLKLNTIKPSVMVQVRGNVGDDNRAKLDLLGMTPAVDIANCREKIVYNADEARTLCKALVDQDIVEVA